MCKKNSISKLSWFYCRMYICFYIRKHTNINISSYIFKGKQSIFSSQNMKRPMRLWKYFGGFKEHPQILCECGLDLVTLLQWTECGSNDAVGLPRVRHKKDSFLLALFLSKMAHSGRAQLTCCKYTQTVLCSGPQGEYSALPCQHQLASHGTEPSWKQIL